MRSVVSRIAVVVLTGIIIISYILVSGIIFVSVVERAVGWGVAHSYGSG